MRSASLQPKIESSSHDRQASSGLPRTRGPQAAMATMTMIIADTLPVGPILIGAAKPAHILTPSVTARGIINMTAVSVAEAQGNG